ncbi:hypothetical protein D0T49_04430 [Paludibacter sp. 221]|uniref:hypothetical protein n=1 Tax=Paludibacter sp. 221 TaxID=2302939 RepID=UPI0013D1A577|nr:hypothetical protein [Paludibacter sp. 221]NDV46284.1 hypothetical protein [Paludibacter sp. 221]
MIQLSICLSDLPKDKIKQATNGKKYINLILTERKEIGQYGETHGISVSKTKEEREADSATIWVGSGKEYRPASVTAEQIEELPIAQDDDLPF